jgi:hypothetical protein
MSQTQHALFVWIENSNCSQMTQAFTAILGGDAGSFVRAKSHTIWALHNPRYLSGDECQLVIDQIRDRVAAVLIRLDIAPKH